MLVRTQDGSAMLETFTFTYNDNIFKTAQKIVMKNFSIEARKIPQNKFTFICIHSSFTAFFQ